MQLIFLCICALVDRIVRGQLLMSDPQQECDGAHHSYDAVVQLALHGVTVHFLLLHVQPVWVYNFIMHEF